MAAVRRGMSLPFYVTLGVFLVMLVVWDRDPEPARVKRR